jgi:Right handed beta helix region
VATLGVAAAALASLAVLLAVRSDSADEECALFASPTGSDAASGDRQAPFRTVGRLAAALGGGGTGCLLEGTYEGNVVVTRGGTPGMPLTLMDAPSGGRATLSGIVSVAESADHVVISGLRIDGSDPPTADGVLVKIFGDHVTLRQNDIFADGRRICVSTGDANGHEGIAWYPVIERNRIHDCGNLAAGPRSYPSGHAVYLQADRHAVVRDNYIYDTNFGDDLGGRGIQLWPDSQDAVIEHNVVDNSNEWNLIISGADYETGTTRGAKVRNNVFTNPVEHNVTSAWWGVDPTGANEVTGNCVFGAPGDEFAFTDWLGRQAYVARDNLRADPLYVDRAAKDFRLRAGSPCEGKGPRAE